MFPRDLCNTLLVKLTGMPSKSAFLATRVVPAKTDDKYYNDKCMLCWDGYSEEHPPVKILPCGHVFGRDCTYLMAEAATGNLCAICWVELFRSGFSSKTVGLWLLRQAVVFIISYMDAIQYLLDSFLARLRKHCPMPIWFVDWVLEGPRFWATTYVYYCTGICSRNPNLRLHLAFGPAILGDTVCRAIACIPFRWVVGQGLGFGTAKVLFLMVEIVMAYVWQRFIWMHLEGQFSHPEDRVTIRHLSYAALVVKGLIITCLLWYEPMTMLGSVWTTLAIVAWR
ncbi:hypothetical protein C7974DRAFT_386799 [Boeremia exigua]|uniref:uncharacterized protein n=1 Tax=Boeremia exigua TaxID=749465 RepID=UPI001E8E6925|nr:uncharacterized protein C7974DRAFT_386799 [Boeremia exigua]KAH6643108.1 hypothetical protein C7974DRAFT_386799 [Boeremia exigua]